MGSQALLYVQNWLLLFHAHPTALDQALRWRLTQQPLSLGSWYGNTSNDRNRSFLGLYLIYEQCAIRTSHNKFRSLDVLNDDLGFRV